MKIKLVVALIAGGATLITSAGGLISQAVILSGNSVTGLSALQAAAQLLTQTEYGSRWLMREGWISLLIGLAFLVSCVVAAKMVARLAGEWKDLTKEGLTIIGWVAMWHPLEIYLYRWWPLRRLGRIFDKLGTMPVEVRLSGV